MADTIGTAYVQVEPSFDGVVPKIDKEFGGAGEKSGKSFSKGFGTVMKGFGAATVGAGVAIGALGSKFVSASSNVAAYGDNIDKMSQKMGLTAEAYQEWDAVMQHSGTSMETMKTSMKTLANAAETGNKAFAELGITEEQIATMSQQDLFEATIAGLQNVEDTTQRTYLAGKLLGRGATELGALLNTSAEDTQAMRDRVKDLGGVMSDDAVKASAAFQDQMQDMQTSFQGLSRNLMSQFLPDVTMVMSGLTEIFSGNSEEGLAQISQGITSIVDGIVQALPQLASTGMQIIEALSTALIDNLPQLIQVGFDIISEIATYILQNLPLLIQTGVQIIAQLALGIAQALPDLIPTIVETMLTIVNYLIENIDLLIDASIAIITGLAEGLITALPVLIDKIPEIILKLVEAIIANLPQILQAGVQIILSLIKGIAQAIPQLLIEVGTFLKDFVKTIIGFIPQLIQTGKELISGLWEGIKSAWTDLKGNLSELANGLVASIKAKFQIGSPSKVFADEIGQWIPAGIAEGIEEGSDTLISAVDTMTDTTIAQGVNSELVQSSDQTQASDAVTNGGTDGLLSILSEYLPVIARGLAVNVNMSPNTDRLFDMIVEKNNALAKSNGGGGVFA